MKVRQGRSQVPSSSKRFSRRQQVDGLGYASGRSHQRAPDFRLQWECHIHERLPPYGAAPALAGETTCSTNCSSPSYTDTTWVNVVAGADVVDRLRAVVEDLPKALEAAARETP